MPSGSFVGTSQLNRRFPKQRDLPPLQRSDRVLIKGVRTLRVVLLPPPTSPTPTDERRAVSLHAAKQPLRPDPRTLSGTRYVMSPAPELPTGKPLKSGDPQELRPC